LLLVCFKKKKKHFQIELYCFFFQGSESITVPWCTDFLAYIMQITPHAWSASTLEAMPTFMAEWYRAHQIGDAYRDIRARVDDDYKKLTSKILFFIFEVL
jgi:hypothetical protein